MTAAEWQQVLYSAVIGQDYSDATLKTLGVPETEYQRLRGVADDIRTAHRLGDHAGARELAKDWGRFYAKKAEPVDQPDTFDPYNPDHLDRIPRMI